MSEFGTSFRAAASGLLSYFGDPLVYIPPLWDKYFYPDDPMDIPDGFAGGEWPVPFAAVTGEKTGYEPGTYDLTLEYSQGLTLSVDANNEQYSGIPNVYIDGQFKINSIVWDIVERPSVHEGICDVKLMRQPRERVAADGTGAP